MSACAADRALRPNCVLRAGTRFAPAVVTIPMEICPDNGHDGCKQTGGRRAVAPVGSREPHAPAADSVYSVSPEASRRSSLVSLACWSAASTSLS
jgi:hypothetical protein